MGKIATHKSWDFKTLSSGSHLNVIFVHGLKKDYTTLSQQWRKCLLDLKTLAADPKLKAASFHIFGFRAATLLRKGEPKFRDLTERIQECVVRLWKSNSSPSFIFIGHGLAGWLVQQALASHSSFTASEKFSSIIGVIFWGLPEILDSNKWAIFIAQFLPKSQRVPGALHFSVIHQTEHNFQLLTASEHLSPEIERSSTSAVQDRPIFSLKKRATLLFEGSHMNTAQMDFKSLGFPLVNDTVTNELAEKLQLLLRRRFAGKRKASIAPFIKDSTKPLDPEKTHNEKKILSQPEHSKNHGNMIRNSTQTGEGFIVFDALSQVVRQGQVRLRRCSSLSLSRRSSLTLSRRSSLSLSRCSSSARSLPKLGAMTVGREDQKVHIEDPAADAGAPNQSSVLTMHSTDDGPRHAILPTPRPDNYSGKYKVNMERYAKVHLSRREYHQGQEIYSTMIDDPIGLEPRRSQESLVPLSFVTSVDLGMAIKSLREGKLDAAKIAFEKLEEESLHHLSESPLKMWETQHLLSMTYFELGKYKAASELLEKIRKSIVNFQPPILDDNGGGILRLDTTNSVQVSAGWTLLSVESSLSLVMAHQGLFQKASEVSDAVLSSPIIVELRGAEETRKEKIRIAKETLAQQLEKAAHWDSKDTEEGQEEAFRLHHEATTNFNDTLTAAGTRTDEQRNQGEYLQGILSTRARVLALAGRRKDAKDINDVVVRDCEGLLGKKHVLTLETRMLEIQLLNISGKIKDAEDRYYDMMDDMRESYDSSHPLTLSAYELQATIYTLQGRLTEARNAAKDLVMRTREKLGDEHPRTIRAQGRLATVLLERGELQEALVLQESVVERTRSNKVFGQLHPFTLECQADLALMLLRSGEVSAAYIKVCELFTELRRHGILAAFQHGSEIKSAADTSSKETRRYIFDISKKGEGQMVGQPYVVGFLRVLQCLGNCESVRDTGDQSTAVEILAYVLQLWKSHSISTQLDLDTLACLHDLAVAERKNDMLERALENLTTACAGRASIIGCDHQHTLLTQFERNLVKCLLGGETYIQDENTGGEVTAKPYQSFQQTVEAQKATLVQLDELLGESHFAITAARTEFSTVLQDMDYLDEAAEMQLEVLWTQLPLWNLSKQNLEEHNSSVDVPVCGSSAKAIGSPDSFENSADHAFACLLYFSNSSVVSAVPIEPRVLTAIARIVEIEWDKGSHKKAIIAQKALINLGLASGFTSDRFLEATQELGYMHQAHADACLEPACRSSCYQEATAIYNTVLEGHLSKKSFLYLATRANLGAINFRLNRFIDARRIQDDIVQLLQIEPELVDIRIRIDSVYNLALTHKAMDNFALARERLHEAMKLSIENLGRDDPQSVKLLAMVGAWDLPPSRLSSSHVSQQMELVQSPPARTDSFRESWR